MLSLYWICNRLFSLFNILIHSLFHCLLENKLYDGIDNHFQLEKESVN